MVLRTELYGRYKVLVINGLALPVLAYRFGVIYWGTTDLQQRDRRTRKFLTMHAVHHPSAEVDRLLAMKEVEACSISRQCTSLAFWGWNVISMIVAIRICNLYVSVTL